jgi:hypothetical protein
MGQIQPPQPVLLILAAFSRHPSALEWAAQRAAQVWGPIALSSPHFEFRETRYYESTMGEGILKTFLAFEELIEPGRLIEFKHAANAWEDDYRAERDLPELRPLNLDPGYLSEAKLVLATTKDRDHRLYLGQGIFGEVTLVYQRHQWQPRPWTYPDYCRADYHQFFMRCRDYLRQRNRGNSYPAT